ncbi:MAG: hypothetical protein IID03_11845 [Candidatus Dadabacteria bacterium]|nr:hypothetical protein [Candidatus Dadabacteria bacterium]
MTSLIINPYKFAAPSAEIITENLLFDFDADLGLTIENTDRLQAWADQASNVSNLDIPTNDARRPVVITNGNPNGDGNSILYDGITHYLRVSGGFTFNQPETIYLVFKQVTWTFGDGIFDGNGSGTMGLLQRTSTPNLLISAGTQAAENSDAGLGTWVIGCAVYNGASSSLRINNNAKTTGNAGATNSGGLFLGRDFAGNNKANFAISRLLGYDTAAHSDAEQDQNITALNIIYSVF